MKWGPIFRQVAEHYGWTHDQILDLTWEQFWTYAGQAEESGISDLGFKPNFATPEAAREYQQMRRRMGG